MNDPQSKPSVSWLTLEKLALGELSEADAAAVTAVLGDPRQRADAAVLERITSDKRTLPPLPPLGAPARMSARTAPEHGPEYAPEHVPDHAPGHVPGHVPGRAGRRSWPTRIADMARVLRGWRLYVGATVAVAAAAVALVMVSTSSEQRSETAALVSIPGSRVRIKGGDVAIGLVRERAGHITHDPDTYAPGDRFKVLVTCPPSAAPDADDPGASLDPGLYGDVVVYQDNRVTAAPGDRPGQSVSFPLPAPSGPLSCGNRVALPGAFHLSGQTPAHVCLVFASEHAPTREHLMNTERVMSAPEHAVCITLAPQ